MYTFSEEGGYSFTQTITMETYQHSSQTQTTYQKTTTTDWEFTPHGYSHVPASDALFKGDKTTTPKFVPRQSEEETEYRQCQTWYTPSKPVQKCSPSQEYLAPHNRYEGYAKTHNKKGRSNIRGHTISSSGESSRHAQSRSQSRQRQYSQAQPRHQRSASRSSQPQRQQHRAYPTGPAISRERAQQRPNLMPVINLTRKPKESSPSTRKQATHCPVAAPQEPAQGLQKVKGKWHKGYVAPKAPEPKICFKFYKHGTCSWGDRCKFEHVAKKQKRISNNPRKVRCQATDTTWNSVGTFKPVTQQTAAKVTNHNNNSRSRNRFVIEDGEVSW